jgi:hypothetical protein
MGLGEAFQGVNGLASGLLLPGKRTEAPTLRRRSDILDIFPNAFQQQNSPMVEKTHRSIKANLWADQKLPRIQAPMGTHALLDFGVKSEEGPT